MSTTKQPDLFGYEPPAPTAKDLRIVRQSQKALSKEQNSFNKLLAEVQRLQKRLAAWQEFEAQQQQQVSTVLIPLVAALRQARANLIKSCAQILEGKHGGDVPKKAERRLLVTLVIDVCETYFAEPGAPDPEVITIFDTYSPVTHADSQRAGEKDFRDEAQELFGIDIPEDIDFEHLDEFLAKAFASRHDQEEDESKEEQRGSGQRKGSRKAKNDSAVRSEAVSIDPKRSLRDVYRKLASALHPDRGLDDADRNRRTELMQRVNVAYEGVDLLALLELQLEIQQIDEDHLGTVPETLLRQYNQVLRDRVANLKGELRTITEQFRMAMQQQPRSMTPEAVERDFTRSVGQIREDADQLQGWADALRQTAYRKAWLKDWEREQKEEERRQKRFGRMQFIDDEFADAVSVFFDAPSAGQRQGTRGKRKR